jgi:hypothetical protein
MARFLLLFAASIVAVGCTRRVDFAVENIGTHELNDVVVIANSGARFEPGILIPKAHKSYSGPMHLKDQNDLVISWVDANGEGHHAAVRAGRAELQDPRVRMFQITEAMTLERSWLLDKQ